MVPFDKQTVMAFSGESGHRFAAENASKARKTRQRRDKTS
jgi:hypothetical protein